MENDGLGVSLLTVGTVVFHRPPRAPFRFLKDGRRGGGRGAISPVASASQYSSFFVFPRTRTVVNQNVKTTIGSERHPPAKQKKIQNKNKTSIECGRRVVNRSVIYQ